MIISCPSCNKKFEIDDFLIPNEGRDLQCGSCAHTWFYKIEKETSETLTLDKNISNQNVEILEQNENKIEKDLNENISKIKKTENNFIGKFFSYLVVIIISITAIIILIDTFKIPLINVFPGLEIIMFNLFETLKDIKLFIIDLY